MSQENKKTMDVSVSNANGDEKQGKNVKKIEGENNL